MILHGVSGSLKKKGPALSLRLPHWFEVALRTPQLWTTWGNDLQDWERPHTCPIVSGLHLEFDGRSFRISKVNHSGMHSRIEPHEISFDGFPSTTKSHSSTTLSSPR